MPEWQAATSVGVQFPVDTHRFPAPDIRRDLAAQLAAAARHASVPKASPTSAGELRRAAYSPTAVGGVRAARVESYCWIREDPGQSVLATGALLRFPFRPFLSLRWGVTVGGGRCEILFHRTPGISHLHQVVNLLLDSG